MFRQTGFMMQMCLHMFTESRDGVSRICIFPFIIFSCQSEVRFCAVSRMSHGGELLC